MFTLSGAPSTSSHSDILNLFWIITSCPYLIICEVLNSYRTLISEEFISDNAYI